MEIPKYNRVYTKKVDNTIEVKPEYIFMMIPSKYLCTYMKLLHYIADLGKNILDDCSAICKTSNKDIISCWAMFQSAISCYNLGREKEADLLINYINKEINLIINNKNKIEEFPITSDGSIKAVCECGKDIKFVINESDKDKYNNYELHKDDGKVFVEQSVNQTIK